MQFICSFAAGLCWLKPEACSVCVGHGATVIKQPWLQRMGVRSRLIGTPDRGICDLFLAIGFWSTDLKAIFRKRSQGFAIGNANS